MIIIKQIIYIISENEVIIRIIIKKIEKYQIKANFKIYHYIINIKKIVYFNLKNALFIINQITN